MKADVARCDLICINISRLYYVYMNCRIQSLANQEILEKSKGAGRIWR